MREAGEGELGLLAGLSFDTWLRDQTRDSSSAGQADGDDERSGNRHDKMGAAAGVGEVHNKLADDSVWK